MSNNPSHVFFGTDSFSTGVLDQLEAHGLPPELVVTVPDTPRGRKQIITPPEAKLWAEARSIPVCQPERLKGEAGAAFIEHLSERGWEIFTVASYGLIIPEAVLSLPSHGTLNVHPSLLPDLRGPSPIQYSILYRERAGVTIMEMDRKMDHGPIVIQQELETEHWPLEYSVLESRLSECGGRMLSESITPWINGELSAIPQDHSKATYTSLISKKDAELDLSDPAELNYRKILAYSRWPRAYFYTQRGNRLTRVVVTEATLENGELMIRRVIPEGKKEMSYDDFLRGAH